MRDDRWTPGRGARRLLLVGLSVAAMIAAGGTAQAAPSEGTVVPARQHYGDQYIVVLRDGPAGIGSTAAALTGRYGGKVRSTYTATIHGFSVAGLTDRQARRLAADPAVRTVYEDGTARAEDTQTNPPSWGLDRVDQAQLPLNSSYTYPASAGAGVTAYVIDTGVRPTHAEFEGRASVGTDFVNDGRNGVDCSGHGSHVAGTVAGKTVGVAKKAKVVAVRVLNCGGSGPDSASVDGIEWVTRNARKPAVANMSILFDTVGVGDEAITAALAAGVSFAVAAGNQGSDACQSSPARVPGVIATGNTDNQDNRNSGSNYGSCVALFAPGTNITSVGIGNDTSLANMTGTSMASPHAAGAAALYLGEHPEATPAQVRAALIGSASTGVVKNPGSGSPNKLLNVGGGSPPSTCAARDNGTDVAIPDAGAAVNSTVTQTGCAGKASASLPVRVDIDHTYTADLAIDLVGPSGAAHSLKKAGDVGVSTGVHTTYTVDASAEDANGTWALRVRDVYTYDTGTLDRWVLGGAAVTASLPTDQLRPTGNGHAQIIGGELTTVAQYPYVIAGVRVGSSGPQGQSCTGAVVAARKIITSAHCMIDVGGDKSYVYGDDDLNRPSTGEFKTRVASYKAHPGYTGSGSWQQGHDVAVITVADDLPVAAANWIKVASAANADLTRPGRQGVVLGYGQTVAGSASSSGKVKKATLPINDASGCQVFNIPVDPQTMICAGYNDGHVATCSGDSGGPLVVDGYVVGTVSWGASGCDRYSISSKLTGEMGDWANREIGGAPPTGTFTLGLNPGSVKVERGRHISTTVTSAAGSGGPERVTLTATGLPSGARAVFQPSTLDTANNAKLTIDTTTATPKGSYEIVVSGQGTANTATTRLTLVVGDGTQPPSGVTLSLSPASGTVSPGVFTSTKVTVTGGTGPLTLTSQHPGIALDPFFLPSSVSSGGTSTMQVAAPFTPGTYQITVIATDSSGRSGSAVFTLTVR
ncbi:S8 family serine peptidase [Longispora urticae]